MKETKKMYDSFELDVELTLITPQLGTVPKSQEILDMYIKTRSKGKETKDEFASPLTQEQSEEKESKAWTGFMEEDGKPFIMEYLILGFLKSAANLLKDKEIPVKNLKSKLEDFIFVSPRKIFFENEEQVKIEPYERPIRAMTMQGPLVSIIRSDQVSAGSKLRFKIKSPYKSEISIEMIKQILDHGQYKGLGQFRNGGFGRFEYKILNSE